MKKLPKTGGGLVAVLVTMELDRLLAGLGTATMSAGGYVSADRSAGWPAPAASSRGWGQSRSSSTSAGRSGRTPSPSASRWLVRDQGCTAEGCSVPAAWCDAHHRVPWSAGGGTSVRDGRLVCGKHHRMIHRPGFEADYLPNGKIRISRRRQ